MSGERAEGRREGRKREDEGKAGRDEGPSPISGLLPATGELLTGEYGVEYRYIA
jgi:hypothetical protein